MGKVKLIPELRFSGFDGEWEEKKVKDIFSLFNGYAFNSSDATANGCRWVKITDVGINSMNNTNPSFLPSSYIGKYPKFLCKSGDYVIALTRPILNGQLKIAKIDNEYNNSLLNQRVGKLEAKEDLEFVFQLLQQNELVWKIENRIAGTDPPNLSPVEINNLKINIPNHPEQTRIATFLTSVDRRISLLTQKKEKLVCYKQGVMQKIFSQELRFKDDDGKDFPEWEEKRLGDVCEIKSGLSKDQNGKIEGYKVTRIETISDGTINIDKAGYIDIIDNISNYKIQKGDILFSNINSVSHIGKTAIAYSDLDLYHGMNLLCLKCKVGFYPLFLYYILNTVKLRNYFKAICNQAVSQASINQTELGKTILDIPSFPEQTRIASFLTALDQQIEKVDAQIGEMKGWKKGLLQKMFV